MKLSRFVFISILLMTASSSLADGPCLSMGQSTPPLFPDKCKSQIQSRTDAYKAFDHCLSAWWNRKVTDAQPTSNCSNELSGFQAACTKLVECQTANMPKPAAAAVKINNAIKTPPPPIKTPENPFKK